MKHLLELGKVYEATDGSRWACVDWSDSHGLAFICVWIRHQPLGGYSLGCRADNPTISWFNPDGSEVEGPNGPIDGPHQLVAAVEHGPNYLKYRCYECLKPARMTKGTADCPSHAENGSFCSGGCSHFLCEDCGPAAVCPP